MDIDIYINHEIFVWLSLFFAALPLSIPLRLNSQSLIFFLLNQKSSSNHYCAEQLIISLGRSSTVHFGRNLLSERLFPLVRNLKCFLLFFFFFEVCNFIVLMLWKQIGVKCLTIDSPSVEQIWFKISQFSVNFTLLHSTSLIFSLI